MDQSTVQLIGQFVWPITTIAILLVFYQPLITLSSTLGQRITRFSVFRLRVELGRLSRTGTLNAAVERLRSAVIFESGMAPIIAGVIESSSTDYIIIEIGSNEDEWLTSRLFLLAAILERSRGARCLVFLGGNRRFIGAATPRDVRVALGALFPIYETVFAFAYGNLGNLNSNIFRGGLSERFVDILATNFLINYQVVQSAEPNPDIGWIKLKFALPKSDKLFKHIR